MDDLYARIQARRGGLGPEFEHQAIMIRVERDHDRIARKYPTMAYDEVSRRARISACFPKGRRERLAFAIEMAWSSMHPICQGTRRTSLDTASRFCALFPDVLAIEDLIQKKLPNAVRLHASDLGITATAA